MTEAEWLACTDPTPMLVFLKRRPTKRSVKQRKLRLFSVACCRRIWPFITHERSRAAVLVAEQFADAQATSEELQAADSEARAIWLERAADHAAFACHLVCTKNVSGFHVSVWAARAVWRHQRGKDQRHDDPEMIMRASPEEEAEQCRLIRDIFGNPFRRVALHPSWLTWNDGTIPKLAQSIYDDCAFDRMPILADALEEAGCTNADILDHCRSVGEHVRGCWVVDLIRSKQ